jgi:hypothetical protein
MTHHLSTLQVQQLGVSALPEAELVAAAMHTTECQSCHDRFVAELKRQRGSIPLNFTLEPEYWFRHDHVDFEQLVALADKTLDQDTEEIINIHLKTCESCREDVRSFLAFRNATAREMNVSFGPIDYESTYDVPTPRWWQRLQTRPAYAVAAILFVAIAVLIGVVALNRRSGPLEANKQEHQNPDIERSPSVSSSPAPSVVSSPSSGAESEKVAILKDRGGEVTIDKNGRITGLDELSETNRQYIAQAALSEHLEPPDGLRHLSGEQSGLRGNDNGRQGFRLVYPVRRVVIDNRPLFQWESLSDVSSYRVYVLDANGNQVGESEELAPTKTQWKAPAPLPRGQVFSWTVVAVVDGKKVVSPSASAPEIKFAVLSAENFQELTSLKKSNSHLALGVFYARAGLLNEAEREFQSLLKLNPQSELTKKLLQSVRSKRKAN